MRLLAVASIVVARLLACIVAHLLSVLFRCYCSCSHLPSLMLACIIDISCHFGRVDPLGQRFSRGCVLSNMMCSAFRLESGPVMSDSTDSDSDSGSDSDDTLALGEAQQRQQQLQKQLHRTHLPQAQTTGVTKRMRLLWKQPSYGANASWSMQSGLESGQVNCTS